MDVTKTEVNHHQLQQSMFIGKEKVKKEAVTLEKDEDKKKKLIVGSGSSVKKGGGGGGGGVMRCCQAEKCSADLSDAKQYHKRHKVCEHHAKAQVVVVGGIRQRFCQQCSRFHELSEFDETKRSCRRRLAGHNERRRKNSAESSAECSSRKCGNHLSDLVDDKGRIQLSIQENATYKHISRSDKPETYKACSLSSVTLEITR